MVQTKLAVVCQFSRAKNPTVPYCIDQNIKGTSSAAAAAATNATTTTTFK